MGRCEGDQFCSLDASIQQGVRQILQFYPNLVRQGGRRSAADPLVIALAMVNNGTAATEKTATLLGHWAHGHPPQ
ncbi:MAG TPA: hypothetical protein VN306_01615 [Mycobacterium sp.]|nr:hypothetical protein [Mycobacterium sp.]